MNTKELSESWRDWRILARWARLAVKRALRQAFCRHCWQYDRLVFLPSGRAIQCVCVLCKKTARSACLLEV